MYREISDLGSFCTNLALRARSVQKRPRFDISWYRPRVRLIRSYKCVIIMDTSFGKTQLVLYLLIVLN
jgi:hypothetical protein